MGSQKINIRAHLKEFIVLREIPNASWRYSFISFEIYIHI